ncbi:MFS transporter [uncultured Thiodictyon sp.]|uniref:MFS transporter n=1 Tax=uncultured Thiodictyon sp. TaxID=1846217 RepID=UPI0025DA5D6A|nr:MFS transporter [uncultured Thiodictyon sp.]
MDTAIDPIARETLKQITWRLIPALCLLYIVAYLDRINIGFAALQMNQDLQLSAVAYGTGAGLFFLGYVLFEIPSNLILQRLGPRVWIARIMVSWGLISMLMATTRSEQGFYVLRFLLGVAEAGFFPGIILYLTAWFPARERAQAIALFATATALAGLIGSPLSGAILQFDGWWGWRGWHWLFVLEGLPAVLLGLVVLVKLPDGPEKVRWLPPGGCDWLHQTLRREREAAHSQTRHTLGEALASGRVWLLGLVYFCMVIGMYGIGLWLPQMLRALTQVGDITLGLLNAVPFLAASLGMVLIGWHSDRRAERRWHIAGALVLAAAGSLLAAQTATLPLALLAFSLAAVGVWGVMGPFWALATSFLSGTAAAGGIALINSLGNVGGFVGPYLMGWFKDLTAGYGAGLAVVAAILLLGAVLVLLVRPLRTPGLDQQPSSWRRVVAPRAASPTRRPPFSRGHGEPQRLGDDDVQ